LAEQLRPIIEAARDGDREALERLAGCADRFLRMFSGKISRQLRRAQGSTIDFVLEGLAVAFAQLESFEYQSDEQFYAWVTRTIRSRMVDGWRREAARKRAGRPISLAADGLEPASSTPQASEIAAANEVESEVAKAILELHVEHPLEMDVVVMKSFDGHSWETIRALLDLSSVKRARSLFAAGLDMLRPRLATVDPGTIRRGPPEERA